MRVRQVNAFAKTNTPLLCFALVVFRRSPEILSNLSKIRNETNFVTLAKDAVDQNCIYRAPFPLCMSGRTLQKKRQVFSLQLPHSQPDVIN